MRYVPASRYHEHGIELLFCKTVEFYDQICVC